MGTTAPDGGQVRGEVSAVGVIGLGRMGSPIARNLLRAGHPVTVFDVDPDRCDALAAAGARVAHDPAEVAGLTEISLSVVMDDVVLRRVALGADGVLAGAAPGHLYCDLSTVSPQASAEVAATASRLRTRYVCAKVAGSVDLAAAGTLTIFASGQQADVDRARPVLEVLGRQVLFVGPAEAAAYLKLAHSVLVGVYAATVAEALTFAAKGGVDFDLAVDVLESGPLASTQLTLKAPVLKARDFEAPPSDVDTAAKDVDLVLLAARGVAVPMPLTTLVREVMASHQANGGGKRDIWSVLETFEAQAGRAGAAPVAPDAP